MKRKYRPLYELIREARATGQFSETDGLGAMYDIENMGFCKDGVTRWYHLTDLNGDRIYTLKR